MTVTSAWTSPAAAGTLDLAAGAVLTETAWDAMVGNFLWLCGTTGDSITFSPTLTQGSAVSLSSALGRYMVLGKWIFGTIHLVASNSGTGANGIVVGGLPIAARNTANGGSQVWGTFYRASYNPNYTLQSFWASNTTVTLLSGAAATGAFGVNPAVTLASGDTIDLAFRYEAS